MFSAPGLCVGCGVWLIGLVPAGRGYDVLQAAAVGGHQLPAAAVPPVEEQARAGAHALEGACASVSIVGRSDNRAQMILGTFRDRRGTLDGAVPSGFSSQNESDDGANDLVGWLYVGSHNFTPSAWGTLSGSGFNPTLNVSICTSSRSRSANF